MSHSKKLFQIASQLDKYANYETSELDALREAAQSVGESWSGSWLGSESRTYNRDFHPTDEFYKEGKEPQYGPYGTRLGPDWLRYSFDDVEQYINEKAGNPAIDRFSDEGEDAITVFKRAKSSVLSFVYENFDTEADRFLQDWLDQIEELGIFTESDYIEFQRSLNQQVIKERPGVKDNMSLLKKNSTGLFGTSFKLFAAESQEHIQNATKEDLEIPPHIAISAKVLATKQPFDSCKLLNEEIVELAIHLQSIEKTLLNEGEIGTKVFIGHGRSHCWRDLKDFISDRLALSCDEFNRVPTAGLTIPERLKQMLDQAGIAFLVMTAEDEQADGTLHARMNVIHEVGLFQGKLGFRKAIVLLEEDCEKFSNLHGVVEIRFPRGDIRATFEEIREVLEREGMLE